MQETSKLIRNISDTARWVAAYRAMETDRPDALFKDPYATRLMGERGPAIVKHMWRTLSSTWPFTMRTVAFDDFILRDIAAGCDVVINLAAGLDARPYRMALPPALTWIEVDLPGILDEKEAILKNETPVCRLERIRADLANADVRRQLFAELGTRAKRALILTEGLTIYLEASQVVELAQDLSSKQGFHHWVTDIVTPGLLDMMMRREVGKTLARAGSPFKFGPPEGPSFFVPYGWRPVETRSMLVLARQHKRLPFPLNILAHLPGSGEWNPRRPWSGVVLMENTRG
jgi:methyltransferase (TIGR00027 family)